jgi:hypothetical protein
MKQLTETTRLMLSDHCWAMNESNGTYDKRFANGGIERTKQERRRYRELIITTPGLGGKRVRRHSLRRDDPTGAGPERHGVPRLSVVKRSRLFRRPARRQT